MKKLIVMSSLLICLLLAACAGESGEKKTEAATHAPSGASEAAATTGSSQVSGETTTPASADNTTAPVETTEAPTEPAFVPQGKVEIETVSVPTKVTLKELGPVAEGEEKLYFSSKPLIRYEVGEDDTVSYIPVDYMGKKISDQRFGYIGSLQAGLYLLSSFEDTINNSGLMDESGEMLIPCECAIIQEMTPKNTPMNAETQARFLQVVYATEETENEAEAFFYATDAWFSLKPQEGDRFYKGYAKIYDLENKRFVPELTITNPNKYATDVCGGLIYTETTDDVQYIYNADGKEIFKSTTHYSVDLGNGFYILDNKEVYDSEGNLLFKVSGFDYLHIINGSGCFLLGYDAEAPFRSVYDYYGNKLFDLMEGIAAVSEEAGGFFACRNGDTAMLYNAAGEVVCSQDHSSSPAYRGYGIWEFTSNDAEAPATYYYVDGRTASGKKYASSLVNEIKEEQSGVYSFYPWNDPTEKITMEISYPSKIGKGLFISNGKPNQLVDCFSGEVLLTADHICHINGYIYAKIEGVYQVFELIIE